MPTEPTPANPADVRASHAGRIGKNLPHRLDRRDAHHRSASRDFISRS
jgi:hypothetical protein